MSRNPKYIQKWVGYLNSSDREMSRIAAKKLGQTRDAGVISELVKALYNRPDDVRIAAVHALGEIGDEEAVKPLVAILQDKDPLVASAAADSLGEIGSEEAVKPLIKILRDHKTKQSRHFQIHGYNRGFYMSAVHALQRIGTPNARKAVDRYHR
jgi:HEAT repeat protein